MKIDIVLCTRGEDTLPYCLKAIKESVDLNELIMIIPIHKMSLIISLIETFDLDIELISDGSRNIGYLRNLGSQFVSTPYYASIDSDVIVNREWFEWGIETIQKQGVAACECYARNKYAKHYDRFQVNYIKKKLHTFTSLGNTFLNTEVIRKIGGIPEVNYAEDLETRILVEKHGYKWISNMDIEVTHLRSDVDIWRHSYRWAQHQNIKPFPYFKAIGRVLTKDLIFYRDVGLALFSAVDRFCSLMGRLSIDI